MTEAKPLNLSVRRKALLLAALTGLGWAGIRHAGLMVEDATLTCRITRESEAVAVELIYPSAAFTPPAEVQPDFSGESEIGFGLFIIEQSVDSVECASPMPGIASIRLVKRASADANRRRTAESLAVPPLDLV